MTGSTLFLGTSFLGAIKQGYDSRFAANCSPATFIGFNAPELAANLESGWIVRNGRLALASDWGCFISGLQQSNHGSTGSKSFPGSCKVSGVDIDLRTFSRIVFVDMFYRQRLVLRMTDELIPTLEGVPVSEAVLAELKINGFNGWVSLEQHPLYGNVPFVSTKRLLAAIREASSSALVFLLSAPRPPSGNIDIEARYGDIVSARRCFEYLEKFYARQLALCGIEYLPQPSEVLDDENVLTRINYSRGAHPTKVGVADEHMNQQYGEAMLVKYSARLLEK